MNENETIQPAQAVPETMKAVTKFTEKHAHEVGLPSPEAVNYMMSVANLLINSALITPDMALSESDTNKLIGQLKAAGYQPEQITAHIQGIVEKMVKANAMAKMLVGHEMGIEPMASMQDIDIVKNRIFIRYPQLIDQMLRKGFGFKWIDRSNERAAVEITRPGMEPETYAFTIQDAKMAGLLGSASGQYEKRPRVMLSSRVVSEAYRMTGGRGNVYTPEEKQEIFGDPDLDQKRMDQLSAQANPLGDFKVGLKAVADRLSKPPVVEPEVVEGKAEPVEALAPTPAPSPTPATPPPPPEAPTQAAEPVQATPAPKTGLFAVKTVMETAGGQVQYVHVENQGTQMVANLRAQALANDTGHEHAVFTSDGDVLIGSFKPPVRMPAPAAQKPTSEAPAPQPVSGTKAIAKARMEALCTKLYDVNGKTAAVRFNQFISEYLGVPPKQLNTATLEQVNDSLDALESALDYDQNEFRAGPAECGKRQRQRRDTIGAYLTKLWPNNAEACKAGMLFAMKKGHSASDFVAFCEAVGLDFMPAADGHALLRMYLKTPEAGQLVRLVKKFPSLSIAKAVEQIEALAFAGKPIEHAEAKDIELAIVEFCKAARQQADAAEETAKPPAPPEPEPSNVLDEPEPAEPQESEENQGGLFEGTW